MSADDRVVELLEELVAWTRFGARATLLDMWDNVLKDDKHLLAYELSDGTRSQTEVAAVAGISQPTVSILWQRWRKVGIVRTAGGRAVHLAKPSDMGMERAQKLVAATKDKGGVASAPAADTIEAPQ